MSGKLACFLKVLWWYCGVMVLWSFGFVVLWFCGTMVLWYYGFVVLWFCGPLVLWYYGLWCAAPFGSSSLFGVLAPGFWSTPDVVAWTFSSFVVHPPLLRRSFVTLSRFSLLVSANGPL